MVRRIVGYCLEPGVVRRSLIVVGNLVVAVALSALQVAVVVGASALRGAE